MNNVEEANRKPFFVRAFRAVFSKRGLRVCAFLLLCLITLVALLHAVDNWRGQRAFNAFKRDVEARGETLDIATLFPKEVPEQENFVATPFVRTMFDSKSTNKQSAATASATLTNRWPDHFERAQARIKRTPSSQRPTTDLVAWREALEAPPSNRIKGAYIPARTRTAEEQAEAAPAVLERLKVYNGVIEELRGTSSRPRARYPVVYSLEDPFAILLPHLGQIRGIGSVLNLRACAELAKGDSAAALKDVLLILRLAESLEDEGLLISQLVRMSLQQISTQPVWEGLVAHRWTEEQLATLQQHYSAADFVSELPKALSLERASGIVTIETARKRGWVDYMNALGGEESAVTSQTSPWARMLGALVPRGWFRMEQANLGRLFDEVFAAATNSPFDPMKMKGADQRIQNELKGGSPLFQHNLFARLLLPALGNAAMRFAGAQITAEQAATACALERYRLARGEYPESLQALTPTYLNTVPYDYFGKQPLSYKREGSGYVLYSWGADGKDDGGKPAKVWSDFKTNDLAWRL